MIRNIAISLLTAAMAADTPRVQAVDNGQGQLAIQVDGREAVTFLKRIKECVENPERIMMEI